ncbi:MAG: S-layer homology domain-containing protein [Clostridiaceae bacterium]|nr:S-layer homology domain-containing protein [Clostridiaceae bacterium]
MRKKIIATIMLIALIFTQIFVPFVYADRDDLMVVADELHGLSDDQKQALLSDMWDIGQKYVGDADLGGKIDNIFNEVKQSLESRGIHIIIDEAKPGDEKIGASSVKVLIKKIVDHRYRSIVEDIYKEYEFLVKKPIVKAVLGISDSATQGQVFAAILNMKIPVLTTENGNFKRNGDVADAVAEKLAAKIVNMEKTEKDNLLNLVPGDMKSIFESILDAATVSVLKPIIYGILTDSGSDSTDRGMNINQKMDRVAEELNKKLPYEGVTRDDVIRYLELYGLYKETVVTPPEGGGGTPTGPSTPTTPTTPKEEPEEDKEQKEIITAVETIVEAIKEDDIVSAAEDELAGIAQDLSKKLSDAALLISAIKDPEVAVDMAKTLIEKTGILAAKLAVTNKTTEYDAIVKDTKQLANAVILNVGKLEIDAEAIASADGKVTAQIKLGDAEAGKLIDKATEEKLDLIVSTAQQLNQAAREAGIEEDVVAPVLFIDASTGAESTAASVEVPTSLILALDEKGIEGMILATDVATFTVPANALNVEANATIKFNSEKVDVSTLSSEARTVVGDAPVYDLYFTVNEQRVSNFNDLIGVTVPYTLKAGEDPEKITVFYINEAGQLENVIGKYDAETGSVYFETEHFSQYAVKVNNVTFSDVDSKFWAANYIEVMASKGVIKGVGDGSKFAPNNNVTRAEFVAMIVREFKLFDKTAVNNFKDVSEKDWFYPEVTSAAKLGIVQGRPGGIFAPNDKITREEMAKMLSNALTIILNKKVPANKEALLASFKDSELIADYAKDAVAMGVRYGIFSGRPDGTFAPKDTANRAEASKLIYMLFYME